MAADEATPLTSVLDSLVNVTRSATQGILPAIPPASASDLGGLLANVIVNGTEKAISEDTYLEVYRCVGIFNSQVCPLRSSRCRAADQACQCRQLVSIFESCFSAEALNSTETKCSDNVVQVRDRMLQDAAVSCATLNLTVEGNVQAAFINQPGAASSLVASFGLVGVSLFVSLVMA
jgi:hypothetical protein